MSSLKRWVPRVLLGCLLLAPQRSLAAVDMFLKLVDSTGATIQGESTDKQHSGEIVALAFSQGVSVAISAPSGGGGSTAGKASFSDIALTKLVDKSSPLLYLYAAQGKHLPQAVLTVRNSGATPFEFYRITLTDVLISSVQNSGASGGDRPVESLSLNFARVEWRYTPQNADGTAGTPVITTWNLATGTP
jgi:type VI secretion system secreted protein Hcp